MLKYSLTPGDTGMQRVCTTHAGVCACQSVYVSVCVYVCVRLLACVRACVCVRAFYMRACVYYVCVCVRARARVCVCVLFLLPLTLSKHTDKP